MEKINLNKKASEINKLYEYKKIADINDHMINMVKTEVRTLDFHTHGDSDEAFFVFEGQMQLEFENEIHDLAAGDIMVVPKGVKHRPVCTKPCTCILIEKCGTLNASNTGGAY